MAESQRQIRDGGTLLPTPAPAKAPVLPVGPDMLARPVPSPARELQERLGRHAAAADFTLPQLAGSRRELGQFIASAVALWGGALGLIIGLMYLAR